MPINNYNRRRTSDSAIQNGDSFDAFSDGYNAAGDFAVAQSLDMSAVPDTGEIEPFQRLPISKPEIAGALDTLQKYRQGKAHLEQRLIENQQWYRLRQWEVLRKAEKKNSKQMVEPASGWLLNSIANKHADAMDSFPSANIVPREEGDKQEAKNLSAIIPIVLDQCDFEGTYSQILDDKIESGTGVYGIFWDPAKHNGLGDIDITCVDLINLFWESGITDIQQSRNVFYVSLQDNDILEKEALSQVRQKGLRESLTRTFDICTYKCVAC